MKIIGIKKFDFKGEDGKQVTGIHLLATQPSTKENVKGVEWEVLKMSTDNYMNTKAELNVDTLVDKSVQPVYNRYGKVERLLLVK